MNTHLLLLSAIALAALVLLVAVIRLVAKLTAVASAAATALNNINKLSPLVESVLVNAETELVAMSSVTARIDRTLSDVEQSAAVGLLAQNLGALVSPVRFVSAFFSGANA